jgi:hypothetical protein
VCEKGLKKRTFYCGLKIDPKIELYFLSQFKNMPKKTGFNGMFPENYSFLVFIVSICAEWSFNTKFLTVQG